MRQAQLARKTKETDIQVAVKLDNIGTANIDTGIGFFDHMLTALSVHSGISMDIAVKGDLYVDGHHTVEDTGIVLGKALGEALGANVIQVIGGMIVLQRPIDEEKVRAKKAARAGDKKVKKKKVHIKGMRQRQREKEEKNPYAKYDRPKYYGR